MYFSLHRYKELGKPARTKQGVFLVLPPWVRMRSYFWLCRAAGKQGGSQFKFLKLVSQRKGLVEEKKIKFKNMASACLFRVSLFWSDRFLN